MASLPHHPSEPDTININGAAARRLETPEHKTISYMAERVMGTGSFDIVFQGTGSFDIVFQAKCLEMAESVVIKKVLQDKRYKNRELQLMRTMDHPNVMSLKHRFFSMTDQDVLFLNLVMEYVPETVYRVLRHYNNVKQQMSLVYGKLYMYHVFAACSQLSVFDV